MGMPPCPAWGAQLGFGSPPSARGSYGSMLEQLRIWRKLKCRRHPTSCRTKRNKRNLAPSPAPGSWRSKGSL